MCELESNVRRPGPKGPYLVVCLLALTLFVTGRSAAEIGVWEPMGPLSGLVSTLAVPSADPMRLYADHYGKLLRSDDGGRTWRLPARVGDDFVIELAVAPSDPDVVYFSSWDAVVRRSDDGGATWRPGAPFPEDGQRVDSLTVDPADPYHLLTGGSGSHVYVSRDGGERWSQATLRGGTTEAIAFAFDPVEPATVYLATTWDYYRSLDGGETWTHLGGNAGNDILGLVVHPSRSGVLFAATEEGIEGSSDGGETWDRLGPEPDSGTCAAIAAAPWDGDRLFASCSFHLWASLDGGVSWSVEPEPLADTDAWQIEVGGAVPGVIYLATGSGVVASFDGGATWRLRTPRLGDPAWGGRFLRSSRTRHRAFLGTWDGLYVADPPERAWRFFEPYGARGVSDLAAEPFSNRIYAATGGEIRASADGGLTWTVIAPGMDVRWLSVDPLHPATVYAWDYFLGLLRSTDRGETWTLRSRKDRNCLTSIEADTNVENTFFGTTTCCAFDTPEPCGGVFVTHDGWATQHQIFEGDAAAVAFRAPKTLFVGGSDGVYRSDDLGKRWALVSDEVETGAVTALLIDPANPEVVYAGTTAHYPPTLANLIVSEDGGDTWHRLDDGLPGSYIEDLAIDPLQPWFLYASEMAWGVWRLQLGEIPLPQGPGGRPLHPLLY